MTNISLLFPFGKVFQRLDYLLILASRRLVADAKAGHGIFLLPQEVSPSLLHMLKV